MDGCLSLTVLLSSNSQPPNTTMQVSAGGSDRDRRERRGWRKNEGDEEKEKVRNRKRPGNKGKETEGEKTKVTKASEMSSLRA